MRSPLGDYKLLLQPGPLLGGNLDLQRSVDPSHVQLQNLTGFDLEGKTLGIIGTGRIGSTLAKKCIAAFEMKVYGYDPYASAETMNSFGVTKVERLAEMRTAAIGFAYGTNEIDNYTNVSVGAADVVAQEIPASPAPATGTVDSTYKLGPGDKVQINVFNQADLSGEYTLDGDGRFSMPLIGTVDANGLTPLELEALLVGRFKPDYLVNPRFFIQVGNYRPYYLMGEVAGTGAFPYQPGMTYLTAIANAGGFTYRAKQDHVYVIRSDDPEQKEIKLSVDEKVLPGDIIRVGS